MIILHIILLISAVVKICGTQSHAYIPVEKVNFCSGNNDIVSNYYPMNEGYDVAIIKKNLTAATLIKVKFDSIATVTPSILNEVRFTSEEDLINNIFSFVLLGESQYFTFHVQGKDFPHHPPYIVSLKINGEENCKNPNRTYFEKHNFVAKYLPEAPDKFCGRRKVNKESIPLIVSGSTTKAGHWPWHAAINRLTRGILNYICGGTLISKYVVLTGFCSQQGTLIVSPCPSAADRRTSVCSLSPRFLELESYMVFFVVAAHCATVGGRPVNPDLLGVVLGKYNLHRIEVTNQDIEVSEVIVHDEYNKNSVNNDIALLKLSTEATFNNFVQPACIWFDGIYDNLPSFEITGTVVGWGIDQSDILSKSLRSATLPIVPDITCIRYEPIYYSRVLNGKKFCVGNSNGTSACNGDSGGGFVVFVEDDRNYDYYKEVPIEERPGAWYVKGIVSATLARKDADICDPNAYTVYTDVAQYRDWILTNMR